MTRAEDEMRILLGRQHERMKIAAEKSGLLDEMLGPVSRDVPLAALKSDWRQRLAALKERERILRATENL